MSPLQKSGLYYPNKFGLITIKSLEEVMGKNGLNAILNLAGMNNYIENRKNAETLKLSIDVMRIMDEVRKQWGIKYSFE